MFNHMHFPLSLFTFGALVFSENEMFELILLCFGKIVCKCFIVV